MSLFWFLLYPNNKDRGNTIKVGYRSRRQLRLQRLKNNISIFYYSAVCTTMLIKFGSTKLIFFSSKLRVLVQFGDYLHEINILKILGMRVFFLPTEWLLSLIFSSEISTMFISTPHILIFKNGPSNSIPSTPLVLLIQGCR